MGQGLFKNAAIKPAVFSAGSVISNCLAAAVYVLLARLSLLLAFPGSNASPVWPPSGFALALLLLAGYRLWPGIAIGAFAANLWLLAGNGMTEFSVALAVSGATALGNTLEALFGRWFLLRYVKSGSPFDNARNVGYFTLTALLSCLISAGTGTCALCASGAGPWHAAGTLLYTWWTGDVAGMVIVTPLILLWQKKDEPPLRRGWVLESAVVVTVLAVVTAAVFGNYFPFSHLSMHEYIIIPFLLWVGFRLGRRMTVTAIALVSIIVIAGTITGRGPFAHASLNTSLIVVQEFLAIVATTMLILSAGAAEVREKQTSLVREINERTNAERQIIDSRNLYRTLVDNLPQSVFLKDTQSRYVSANDSFARTVRLAREEIAGKNDFALFQSDLAQKHLADDAVVLAQGKTIEIIESFTEDGQTRWVQKFKTPVRDERGSITGILGIFWDITQQKTAQEQIKRLNEDLERKVEERTEALKRSTEELDRFFTVALDLLCIADTDGYFHRVNRAWETTLGYRLKDLEGRKFFDFIHPDDISSTQNAVATLSSQSDVWDFVNRYRCADGSYRWIEWRSTPVGGLIYAAARDVTAQRESQQKLLAALKEADSANRAKSEFLANISHEIRTPLNAIIGFSELLRAQSKDRLDATHLDSILMAGRSLLRLINDILDLSKIEAGMMNVSLAPADLRIIFREIGQIFAPRIAEKGLAFEIDTDPSLPRSLLLDEIRVRHVLLNLVGNAVKFTDAGSIRLCAAQRRDSADAETIDLLITVADTGVGIKPQELDSIFEPFRQQSGQSARYGGTGLGLSICRKLTEVMNGTITVESTPGKGSVFTVLLKNVLVAAPETPPFVESAATEAGASGPTGLPAGLDAGLSGDIMPLVKELAGAIAMDAVRDLSQRLTLLGARHDAAVVSAWGDDLAAAADNFDITRIKTIVQKIERAIAAPRPG